MTDQLCLLIQECGYNIHCDRKFIYLDCLIGIVAEHNDKPVFWSKIPYYTYESGLITTKQLNQHKLYYFVKNRKFGAHLKSAFSSMNDSSTASFWDLMMTELSIACSGKIKHESIKAIESKLPKIKKDMALYVYCTCCLMSSTNISKEKFGDKVFSFSLNMKKVTHHQFPEDLLDEIIEIVKK